jgi:hypothetical protein
MKTVPNNMSLTRTISTNNLPTALGKQDRRTRKWRELHETYSGLVAHCGGRLNVVQQEIVTELLRTKQRLAEATNHEDFVRLSNCYSRLLRQLGPAAAEKPLSLPEYLATWQSPSASTGQAEPSQARERPASASRSSTPAEAARP